MLPDQFTTAVTIVVVTFESEALVKKMAQTLNLFDSVIIVDNNSDDHTVRNLQLAVPHATIIQNKKNIGFGPANNRALRRIATPFALLLNPDCEIETESLQLLLEAANNFPNAAILAPQGYYLSGKPQPAYRCAFYEHKPSHYRIPDGITSAKWLHGCCLLLRMAHIKIFNGFDERFFLYYEDDDLCLQALKNGKDCLVVPDAKVIHLGGGSTRRSWYRDIFKDYHFGRSRRMILGKYLGRKIAIAYRIKILIAAPIAILIYGCLFKRKYLTKWLGWGAAAFSKINKINN